MRDWSELQSLAEACKGWQDLTHCWIGEEENVHHDHQDWLVGAECEDGEKYPVMTVDTYQYGACADAEPLAKFYAAANPSAILALIADLRRLEEARATDAGRLMDMTRDIVSIGEALGIPGEEQAGGVDEFIDAIEQLKQAAPAGAMPDAREAFEAWIDSYGWPIQRRSDGDTRYYEDSTTQLGWEAWKARALISATPTPPASEQAAPQIKWGSAGTVGNLIAQLRTIDPAMPVFASLRVKNGIRDGVMLKGLVISYEHGDGRFIVKGGPEKCVVIWTQQDDRKADPDAEWVEKAMEQAQVFASAWSLVGGPFDTGDGLEHAEEEKQRLREMLEAGR